MGAAERGRQEFQEFRSSGVQNGEPLNGEDRSSGVPGVQEFRMENR
jgi:hypothetical protein